MSKLRDNIMERLSKRLQVTKQVNDIDPQTLKVFSKGTIQEAVRLYIHLGTLGRTFEDLIAFLETQRVKEAARLEREAQRPPLAVTREEKKLLRASPGSRRRRQGEVIKPVITVRRDN